MRDLSWLPTADRTSPWPSARVLVAGAGRSGEAAARALVTLGAEVLVVDDGTGERQQQVARQLEDLGAAVLLAAGPPNLSDLDLVVASPGLSPRNPLLVQAQASGVRVWSGERLAWHVRPEGSAWLALTGTNGKTTTVMMLESMLLASGERAAAAGNIGRPLVEAVMAEPGYSVLAVELSSFQLHYTADLQTEAAALLNLGVDHVDWHGSYAAYVRDKARIFTGAQRAVVYNAGDGETERLADAAEVASGCRRVGFTTDVPAAGMVGVVDGVVVDRAFGVDPQVEPVEPVELAALQDIDLPGAHNLENALAAASLARAHGVRPAAVRDGLRGFRPAPHRAQWVATRRGVSYVDDSKATNVDAALVSLQAHRSVVWVAGGLAKGATFDDLVRRTSDRLRGAVLVGQDRALVRDALSRHAPQVPVIEVVGGETGLMDDVVSAAASLAVPGDTVLLAPGCASMDLFPDYAARGDAFAASVRRMPEGER